MKFLLGILVGVGLDFIAMFPYILWMAEKAEGHTNPNGIQYSTLTCVIIGYITGGLGVLIVILYDNKKE